MLLGCGSQSLLNEVKYSNEEEFLNIIDSVQDRRNPF